MQTITVDVKYILLFITLKIFYMFFIWQKIQKTGLVTVSRQIFVI